MEFREIDNGELVLFKDGNNRSTLEFRGCKRKIL